MPATLTLKALAELAVLPPANLLLLFAAGLIVVRRRKRLGRIIQIAAVLLLYLAAMPFASSRVLAALELPAADPAQLRAAGAGAIVVLGGDVATEAPEYGGETVGGLTLERLRYAARIEKSLQLPILVSGGTLPGWDHTLAGLMAETLDQDFGVKVHWREDRSTTTRENAKFSASMLRAAGITRVILVTHSWHMRRALLAFAETGITAVPAPTMYVATADGPGAFLPNAKAVRMTYFAAHEAIGLLWYHLLGAISG